MITAAGAASPAILARAEGSRAILAGLSNGSRNYAGTALYI